jgi:sugar phosphate isomerase/epimerase
VDNPNLRAVFDPANFIQCGQSPYPEAYNALRPWLRYVHVKDAQEDGQVVPAGEGVARWPEILRQLRTEGYDGFFSLEPHLAEAGRFSGFSGPERFRRATEAFRNLLHTMSWAEG